MAKTLTVAERNEKLANELIKFFKKKGYTTDTYVYWNGKRQYLGDDTIEELKVTDYLEYCNPTGISLVFEGALYHAVNYNEYGAGEKTLDVIDKIAEKYGMYYELGHAWSMSFYEL